VTRVGFGPFSFDPVEQLIGAPLFGDAPVRGPETTLSLDWMAWVAQE